MTRVPALRVQHVRTIPSTLADGTLYVSREFSTAAHRCCCGCGREVVTPLGPTDWRLTGTDAAPSMWPSIGNWSFPCQSHYIVRDGGIVWAKAWSRSEIAKGRAMDRHRKDQFFEDRQQQHQPQKQGLLQRVLEWLLGR